MNLHILYISFLVSYVMSCNRIPTDGVREFIPGEYERVIDNEFSKGHDLLLVSHQHGNVYAIEKRSEVIRVRNGRLLSVKYDTVRWRGIYDAKEQVIYEQQKGKVLTFLPEAGKLLVGGIEYQKLNK